MRPVQDGFDITIANVISSKKAVYSQSFWQISRPYNFNWGPFIFHRWPPGLLVSKLLWFLNSCVHYFSIKSCVHISHARKNRKTITVRFTGLKKLHEYIFNGLSSQLNDRMKSLPVISDSENFVFKKIFYCTKWLAVKFQG